MQSPPTRRYEVGRLAVLPGTGILERKDDPLYDAFLKDVVTLCDTPVAFIDLIDASKVEMAFCALTIGSNGLLEVSDASRDPRFAQDPYVAGEPNYRFYAGQPLVNRDGRKLGTLYTFDYRPRALTQAQRDGLSRLGADLAAMIELREHVPAESPEEVALLGAVLAFGPDPIILLRVDGDEPPTIVYANRACEHLLGYASAELTGKTPELFCGPKTDPEKLERLRAAVRNREAGSEVLYVYDSSGAPHLIDLRDRAIGRSHRVVSMRDLTRIHATHEALSNANQRLHSLLSNNSEAVLTIDGAGRCVDANPAAIALFGYERSDLLELGFLAAARDGFFRQDGSLPEQLRTGATVQYSAVYRHREGRSIVVECRATPMIVSNALVGAYLIARDVTEELRLTSLLAEQAKRTHALYLISAKETSNAEQIDAALELVIEALGMQYAYIGTIEGETLAVKNVVGEGVLEVGDVLPLETTMAQESIRSGDIVACDDISDPGNRRENVPLYPEWHGYIAAPLTSDGIAYGAVGFVSKRVVALNDFDRDFVRLVASLVSSAIERQSQKQKLSELAFYDMLTELPNRAKFMRDIEGAIALANRHGRSFAVHYIDLDGFKNVNDRAGHAVGDLALKEAARRLQET
ncbi:MAG: PAS domain S-box protein, partial [Candidatus Eremiobacteraeota bacterium]|nr:PAS domain S-box protein [Candidatus Eremiobacteraeota bacterium]